MFSHRSLVSTSNLAFLISGIICIGACGQDAAAPPVANESSSITTRVAREFLPAGAGHRLPLTAQQRSQAAVSRFDYSTTLVGTSGNVTVYYATSLGGQGQSEAQQLLNHVAGPYGDMQNIFGISGGAVNLIVAPLSGANDGGGGAYHYGCDFTSGGDLYVDATFANTTVDPIAWEIGLYIAELSESFMGPQNAGWGCGSSNGEGLSRYLAEYVMAPNQIPSWGLTAPSWAAAGFPDWISATEGTDGDYQSTGAAVAYIYWVLTQGYSITSIVQTGGSTLSANYQSLTGASNAYTALTSALSGIAVTTDNPWGVKAEVGVRNVKLDVNGDAVGDLLIVDAAGSYLYLGSTSGGFTGDAWVRNDLPINAVTYFPGDFNGDGFTDLIIQTNGGSYEYLGQSDGGFTPDAWVRTDLPLGRASYVVGDFNGDTVDDLIIVTADGSYEYTGLTTGGFTGDVWVRHDLTLSNVGYVVGDFNGDTRADVIIETSGGSYEYTGLAAGGFTPDVWVRTDLPLGSVDYTVGDFDGDALADLIIQTANGSYEYTGLPGGGFTGDVWVRTDLPRGIARYIPGNFNGDSSTDVIIETGGGSYEYIGQTSGGLTGEVWVRTDLPISVVDYFPRDFNWDGAADVIIQTAGGSYEYTGLSSNGFTGDVWVRGDLPLHTVAYF